MPPLEMVKVPPDRSSMVMRFSRARLASSTMESSIWASESWSASRMTGTTSPLPPPTATPTS